MTTTSTKLQCSVFIATSLDGYIARADGSIDWLQMAEAQGEDYGYKAFSDACDTLIIGRATYEVVLGFGTWPYEGKRVVVMTHKQYPILHGEELFSGDPSELVHALGKKGARRAYVDGGNVIQQFLAADLIDDMTISILPILLGNGLPLFGPTVPERRLRLLESRGWPTGLVQVRYDLRSAGA